MHSLPAGGPSADGSARWDGGWCAPAIPSGSPPQPQAGAVIPRLPINRPEAVGLETMVCLFPCSPRPGGPPWVPGTVIKAL